MQIYNVDKRIQEDNLQHLALFSEYGRMALLPSKEEESGKQDQKNQTWSDVGSVKEKPAAASGAEKSEKAEGEGEKVRVWGVLVVKYVYKAAFTVCGNLDTSVYVMYCPMITKT